MSLSRTYFEIIVDRDTYCRLLIILSSDYNCALYLKDCYEMQE